MTIEVVKVYYRKRKTKKSQQIDHIPMCFQLPRSASVAKPRTQFFLPICSFKDIELDSRSSEEIQLSVSAGCSDRSNDTISGTVDLFSTSSTEPESRKHEKLNGIRLPVTDVKSFGLKAHVQPCSNRKNENRDDALELTPNRSQLTESSEALHYKEHPPRSPKESPASPEGANGVNNHNQLPERDNSSSSRKAGTGCSSKAGTGCTERARSKRERKQKVHFDEVSYPLYTSRKVRRFKIMRFLGLAAPVGSPFSFS